MDAYEEFPEQEDPLLNFLSRIIKYAVKALAILMVLVIVWGVVDVVYVLYIKLISAPFMLLTISDMLSSFAAFLAVLIAIEIYQNIILYIRTDVIPVKLVVATALMAIARKVIILDFKEITPLYVFGIAAVVLALGITYYLLGLKYDGKNENSN